MAGLRDIAVEIAASEAVRTLQGLAPVVAEIDQGIHDEAFRAIADGKLNGELAVALWHRLFATEQVRTALDSKAQPARNAIARVAASLVQS